MLRRSVVSIPHTALLSSCFAALRGCSLAKQSYFWYWFSEFHNKIILKVIPKTVFIYCLFYFSFILSLYFDKWSMFFYLLQTIQAVQPDIVLVELCKSRVDILKYDEEFLLREAKNIDMQKLRLAVKQVSKVIVVKCCWQWRPWSLESLILNFRPCFICPLFAWNSSFYFHAIIRSWPFFVCVFVSLFVCFFLFCKLHCLSPSASLAKKSHSCLIQL